MSRCQVLLAVCLLAFAVKDVQGECKVTDDVCEFWLEIDNKLTMMYKRDAVYASRGKLYKYDVPEANTSNATPIDPEHVIVADGWEIQRLVVVANEQMPGPPIVVYEGQEVVVHVKNNMRSDGVTIHWHGLHQPGTPWMDGVPFVTQCPIHPGTSFTYRFKAYPQGTFWYHSHLGAQLGMGLIGAFIIKERKAIAMKEHIMVLQDWNHDWDADVAHLRMEYGSFRNRRMIPTTDSLDGGHFSNFLFQSGLINGKGRYFAESLNYYSQTPLTVYPVEPNMQYRFRVIGAGNLYPFRVSVDGHVLKMVASDGYEFRPMEVESFIINPGERYDFILKTDQTPDNYWVRAESLEVNVVNHVALAILRYKGASDQDPVYRNRPCSATNRCLVVNCPFKYYPTNQYTDCKIFTELKAQILDEAPGADEDVEDIFLNFAFPGTTKTPGSTNGVQFQSPPAPPLTQPKEADTLCRPEHNCGEQKVCTCALSVNLQHGKTYNFIMSNLGKGKGWGHPMHMHGHSFHVVKMGFPSYDQVTGHVMDDNPDIDCRGNVSPSESFCNSPAWANSSWSGNNIPGLDLVWAPRKDTVIVPTGGYAVVRIKADNPGVWFMHCHIELHNLDGMALMINESFDHVPPPPSNFPRCGHYDQYTTVSDDTTDDTTTVETKVMPETGEKTDDDDECEDRDIYFGVIGALAAAFIIQLVIIACLLRRTPASKSQKGNNIQTNGTFHNEAFDN